jgi:hypothetical protein
VTASEIRSIKTALDSQGRWWVSALVVPSDGTAQDAATLYMFKDDRAWKLVELGTGVSTDELPADVRREL